MIGTPGLNPQEQADRIFARCFTKEELEFLKKQPGFVEAIRDIKTLVEAVNAVEFGGRLLAEAFPVFRSCPKSEAATLISVQRVTPRVDEKH